MDNKLLQFLMKPGSYPHKPEKIQHIQTHISHVFIASPHVFKIKKPVNFDFLDYSTLPKRKYFCQREIELNRRLCRGIYLEVVSIVSRGDTFAFETGDAAEDLVTEYAVKMNQLSEEHFLHSYIARDALKSEHLDRVAQKLADFYLRQEPGENLLQWGDIDKIKVNTDENFRQTESFIGQTMERDAFDAIRHFTERFYQQRAGLFKRRVEERRIVDGHGDLHLDHIHITPEEVRIYDCIEFNERFRYGDLAADLAFLAMDLDFNEQWKLERHFIQQMSEKLMDPDLLQIIDFYKCYRAYVKGKVKSLQSSEPEVEKKDRQRAAESARNYFDLSLKYALIGSGPLLLVFMGGVGTGKSTLAGLLSKRLQIAHFSSDRMRKNRAGLPLYQRTPASEREALYTMEMSERTYAGLQSKAEECLQKGQSVILDATYSSRRRRENLVDRVELLSGNYFFIETYAPEAAVRQRLKSREKGEEVVSDARLEDYEKLSYGYDSPEEVPPEHLIKLNTDQPLQQTLEKLFSELIDRRVRA